MPREFETDRSTNCACQESLAIWQVTVIAEGSVVGMIKKVEAGEIKLPLGLHNQKLLEETKFPILPIPLPYELDSGEKIEVPQDPPGCSCA